ncbi:hypothetical protein Ngar_c20120 [Candidatus Nitrososphaera gargensis Ga9.2]|uniref:Uncharacterized protein n=1 Tax=Nitrososphaera gargensis (strain Ga9.2) TaxID=1237085 RepID=K0IN87_NITGG|nr:hypothetical protein [Candidatus Nitrososphaera gargensis]AFU58944.1 hypothetical protein Ngar_c20120 [Candidatus Nitrososphaera gargensis Ga9.2]
MIKLNGENIAGTAFLFFSALLMAAGQVNAVFGKLYPAYYILVAAGVALVFLGYRTARNETMPPAKEHYRLS